MNRPLSHCHDLLFPIADNCLQIGGMPLTQLAERVGSTPFYAYDRRLISERVARLRAALPAELRLHYAIKANPMPAVVQHLAGLVDGFDVASAGELRLALKTAMPPQQVSFAGPGKSDRELREAVAAGHVLPPPYVVKPNNEGSSVGITMVRPGENAPRLAETMPALVMVEAYAPGRELTVTVMGGKPLCVTDIITQGWYDYDAKYAPGGSSHVCPAVLPPEIEAACLDYAGRAHAALGCRGISRTDFRWDEGRGLAGLILLETNTQPGMTPTSLAPEQAAQQGMSFPYFCSWIVEDASCDR